MGNKTRWTAALSAAALSLGGCYVLPAAPDAARRRHLRVLGRRARPGASGELIFGSAAMPIESMTHILSWMLVSLLVGCTTPSTLVGGDTLRYSQISPTHQDRLPILVSWYENCSWSRCDNDAARANRRLTECLNRGIHRATPALSAVSGAELPATQPSVLTIDPRERGAPDPRLGAELRASALRAGTRLLLLVEATTLRYGRGSSGYGIDPGYGAVLGAWGRSEAWSVRSTFDGVLVDAQTGLWAARVRRIYAGEAESLTSGLAFLIPLIHLELTPETERLACEAAGEAIGQMLSTTVRVGRQGVGDEKSSRYLGENRFDAR